MQTSATISTPSIRERTSVARWPAFAILSLGLVVLYFVGFSLIVLDRWSAL